MATIIITKLPIKSTAFGLLKDPKDRKRRVKEYIDNLVIRWPSLQTRAKQFWTDNQTEYNNLQDNSPHSKWLAFFRNFNDENDFKDLAIVEAQQEINNLLKINASDNEVVKELKEITQEPKHLTDLPSFFVGLPGGVSWAVFLVDTLKQFYLTELSNYITTELASKPEITLSDLDKVVWKEIKDYFYSDIYSTYAVNEQDSDFDSLKANLGEEVARTESLIANTKLNKVKEENIKLWTLSSKLTGLLEQIYTNYPEILYGNSSLPTPPPSPVITPTKPDPITPPPISEPVKPTPTPEPTKPVEPTPPSKTPEEIQAEKDAQELQTLKDDISKLPLNSSEQTELTNAKNKPEAEAVRTKYNARVNRAQAEKDEVAKYDQILADIKIEKDQTKLEDNKDYDNRIKTLVVDLLVGKDISALQTERKNKWNQLEQERLTTIETAKYDKLLSDIQGETAINIKDLEDKSKYDQAINTLQPTYLPADRQLPSLQTKRHEKLVELVKVQLQNAKDNALIKDVDDNNWDPVLDSEEQKLINSSNDLNEVSNYQTQIKTKRDNINSASDLLDSLNAWTEITSLPRMADIKAKYDENLVPAGLKYDDLKKARNDIRLKLFKDRFERPTPTGLSDIEIDKWRDNSDATGLDGLGTEERIAFLNGWTVEEIKDKKVATYQITAETTEKSDNINPLIVDKKDLDKALRILANINDPAKTTFKSLPEDYKKDEIASLPMGLPINVSWRALTQRIKERRETFSLSLNNEADDGGFEQAKLDAILQKIKDKYPQNEYKPFTAEIANKVLKYNIAKENLTKKVGKDVVLVPIADLTATIDKDLDDWLTEPAQKGYKIEKEKEQTIKGKVYTGQEIKDQEEEWINTNQRDKQGKLQLPFFCAKVGYNPDKPEEFLCEKGNTIKGCLPFATGSGKTTKIVNCLCNGGKRNVLLVLPTTVLASSAYGHHTSWLQDYECPIHDIKHGEYKVNEVGVLGDQLSILHYPYLAGYVIRELLDKAMLKKWAAIKEIADTVKDIKDGTLLKQINPIIVFDEAHFADTKYKALMEGVIELGYPCLKMSATFEGVPWSITTSYPLTTKAVDGFKPEQIKPEDKTAIFIRNKLLPEQKKIMDDAGVCYVEFDSSMAPAVEGITIGLPKGSVFFMTWIYEMGVSMDVKNVILTNWIETTKLGGKNGLWMYDDPIPQRCPIASLGQERGRVARLYPGNCYILVEKDGVLVYEEVKPTDDAGTTLLKAALSGKQEDIDKLRYKDFKDINMLRGSLAWPDKFGLAPEDILVGANRGGTSIPYPKFAGKQPLQGCDAGLWNRHMRIIETNEMSKETAQDILSQMIGNLVVSPGKINNFPNVVSVEIESPLIGRIGWLASTKPSKDPAKPWVKQDNSKSIIECQTMINGAIEKQLEALPNFQEGKIQYKDEKTFNKVVDIYKCLDGMKITIDQEFKDDWIDKKNQALGKKPKDSLTLKIIYNTSASTTRSTYTIKN